MAVKKAQMMPTFTYEGVDRKGLKIKGELPARNMALAKVTLRKQGIGVQRATFVRQPYFVNDYGDYEQNPSFDFNVTFKRSLFPDTAAISALYPDIHRI